MKRKRNNTATACVCSVCLVEVGSAIPGRPHRHCGQGGNGAIPNGKIKNYGGSYHGPKDEKGVWTPT